MLTDTQKNYPKTVTIFDAEHLAGALQANVTLNNETSEIKGTELNHGVMVTLKPKEINIEDEKNPAIILIAGIRNHPTEVSQIATELLRTKRCPEVNVLHYPYNEPLNTDTFVDGLCALVEQHDSVVLGGLCLGAVVAAEVVNRLPDETRAKIRGLFLMSPTISNELKFLPPSLKRILNTVKETRIVTAGETAIKAIRTLTINANLPEGVIKTASEIAPFVLTNAAKILDIEAPLAAVQPTGELHSGIKIPNVTINWVTRGQEYMVSSQIDYMNDRLSQLAEPSTLTIVNDMPGMHGAVNSRQSGRRYREEAKKWYEQVIQSKHE